MKIPSFDSEKFDKSVLALAKQVIASNEMPEAGIHFTRLRSEGHSEETAKRMIGSVLLAHVYLAKQRDAVIDRTQIRAELAKLPKSVLPPDGTAIDIRGFKYTK